MIDLTPKTREKRCRAASRGFHSIRSKNGRLELAQNEPGLIVDYRDFPVPEKIDLKIAGSSFPVITDGRWHFDPATQFLFRIQRSFVQP